jgi:hypothetical protein
MSELLQMLEDWKGFKSIAEVAKPADYEQRIKETIDLLSNAHSLPVHRHEFLLREAMTTSDFPLLFGDVMDRQVLAAYKGVSPVWKQFVRSGTVNRIYPNIGGYRFAITGGDQYLDLVPQKGEYPASSRAEAQYKMYVKKYGRQFDISWETIVNDDLGALRDTPTRFALAAVRTEHRLVTGLYCDDVGTHAGGNLYQNAVNEDVLPLTIANLEICVQRMQAFTDAAGEPIMNRPKFLVVGPALEFTARQILTSATKMWLSDHDDATLTVPMPFPTTNVISGYGLTLIVDPYIPVLHADAPGSWFLFADPSDIAAIEADWLTGHDRPEICMKDSNKVAVGGGAISPMEGDFETDNILYRVREVFGANKLDWRATYCNIHA